MENLDDYTLLMIFDNLTWFTGLEACTRVCKRWNNLISNSMQSKFSLNLFNNVAQKYLGKDNKMVDKMLEDIKTFQREYSTIKVSRLNMNAAFRFELTSNQTTVRHLKLAALTISGSDFVLMLKSLMFLEILTIESSKLVGKDILSPVDLPSLRSLTASTANNHEFLQYIGETGITFLSLSQVYVDSYSFVSFLKNQPNLSTLDLDGYQDGLVLAYIMRDMTLKSLTICEHFNFHDNVNYSIIPENNRLKVFKLITMFSNMSNFSRNVFRVYSCMEELILHDVKREMLAEIARHLQRLKKLEISWISTKDFYELGRKLGHTPLEALTVKYCTETDHDLFNSIACLSTMKNLRKIQIFNVKGEAFSDELKCELMTRFKQLETLEIHYGLQRVC